MRLIKSVQVLRQLDSTNAFLMLKFLNACCKLENLRQEWMNNYTADFRNENIQILEQFANSVDLNIRKSNNAMSNNLLGVLGDVSQKIIQQLSMDDFAYLNAINIMPNCV